MRVLSLALGLATSLWLPLNSAVAQGTSLDLTTRLALFQSAFPEAILGHAANVLVMRDGTEITIDDGRNKSHAEALKSADIEDMLSQIYPLGRCYTGAPPAKNFDPGRIRNDAFFKSLYGADARAVSADMEPVGWFNTSVAFSRRHGAAAALARVARDLSSPTQDEAKFLNTLGGTFNWRVISGTKRLSAHSFGVAIDVNPKHSTYWRWSGGTPGNVPSYQNKVPFSIVEAFERHGFIWGGKWYHYDTMHFEYRPDLIAIGRQAEALGCVD